MPWQDQSKALALAAAAATSTAVVGMLWWRRREVDCEDPFRQPTPASSPSSNRPQEAAASPTAELPPPLRAPSWRLAAEGSLRERLTVVLATSPVSSHLSTDLVQQVISSLEHAVDVQTCDMIIVCDGCRGANGDATKYEAYKAKLRKRAVAGATPSVKVLELEDRQGFGSSVRAALEFVRTPYVLVLQHGQPFLRRTDIPFILSAMEARSWRLKYVALPTAVTVKHTDVLKTHGIQAAPFSVEVGDPASGSGPKTSRELKMQPLAQWYDSAHICFVDHYRNVLFRNHALPMRSGFIEDQLGHLQLADIVTRGFEVAHPEYATYMVTGDGFAEPCVAHLANSDLQGVNQIMMDYSESLEISVQKQVQEVASLMARAKATGEPFCISSAAARAAEEARIKMSEMKNRKAELNRLAGKEPSMWYYERIVAPLSGQSVPLAPKAAWKEYLVDNGQLQASTPGLGYRLSMNLNDRASDDAAAEWGSTVMGVDVGNGWLQVRGGRYLPIMLQGVCVLSLADGRETVVPYMSRVPVGLEKAAVCPQHGWQYIDPRGVWRGPFSVAEMRHWNSKGYFPYDLPMRCSQNEPFVQFIELFPAPLNPFVSAPIRPPRYEH